MNEHLPVPPPAQVPDFVDGRAKNEQLPAPSPPLGANFVELLLDDAETPFATYRAPAVFTLDTRSLEDGTHRLHMRATDSSGNTGRRTITFRVQNGPGITVTGLREGALVGGTVDIAINAFGGSDPFDPRRAESQGPIPVWVWVMCSVAVLWAGWYAIELFPIPAQFAKTATYAADPEAISVAQAAPAGAEPAPAPSGKATGGGFDYAAAGATVYSANCASCHGASGAGVPGVFPPLANDPVVTSKDPGRHVATVLKGLQGKAIGGKTYAAQMPAFPQLSDANIAAVVDHERTSWGNQAPTVTPDDVKRARGH